MNFLIFLVNKENTKYLDPPIKLRITSLPYNSSLDDTESDYYQQTETDILNPVSIPALAYIYASHAYISDREIYSGVELTS